MKKALFLLLVIGFILTSSYYLHDRIYYRDEHAFVSPLDVEEIILRNDRYGEGHFGAKRKNGRIHKGVDILAPAGEPVLATKSGWAVSKFDKDGYGNYVKIYHRDGYISVYGHLESAVMRFIKKVRQGDVIGWVGKTGNARPRGIKPHLHFEIRKEGVAVDPLEGYIQ